MNQTHRLASRRLLRAGVTTLALSGATLGLAAGPAGAAPGAVVSLDPTGASFVCGSTSYTVTGGSAHLVSQWNQDATGVYHFTGTMSLQHVTATDGTSNAYSIVGASWFGGKGTTMATATVRDTEEFTILGPQGRVGDVHAELTFYPDGSVRGTQFGNCNPPQ